MMLGSSLGVGLVRRASQVNAAPSLLTQVRNHRSHVHKTASWHTRIRVQCIDVPVHDKHFHPWNPDPFPKTTHATMDDVRITRRERYRKKWPFFKARTRSQMFITKQYNAPKDCVNFSLVVDYTAYSGSQNFFKMKEICERGVPGIQIVGNPIVDPDRNPCSMELIRASDQRVIYKNSDEDANLFQPENVKSILEALRA